MTRNCSRVPRLLSAAMRCGGGCCVPNITKLDCCIVRSVCAWTDADDVARAHVADLIDVLSFGNATCRKSERAEGAHLRYYHRRPSVDVCPTERKKIESEPPPTPPPPRRSGKIGRSLRLGRSGSIAAGTNPAALRTAIATATAVGHARRRECRKQMTAPPVTVDVVHVCLQSLVQNQGLRWSSNFAH